MVMQIGGVVHCALTRGCMCVDVLQVYDLDTDPWQMHNIYNSTGNATLTALQHITRALWRCEGGDCRE